MDARTVRRRPSWRAVATVVVAGLLGLTPLSATASDDMSSTDDLVQAWSSDQCSNSFFCLWSGSNYTGAFTQTVSTVPAPVNATSSQSVWNRTTRAVRVYSGAGATGSSVCYGPNARSASISIASRSIVVQSGTSC